MDPTATHLPILCELLASGKVRRVLEFGAGLYSTRAFVNAGCDVTSIEMQHPEWAEKVTAEVPGSKVILALGPDAWRSLDLAGPWDLVFVDGHGDSRPECLMWAKDHAPLIVAHDTEHPYYGWDRADMSGYVATEYREPAPWTTVWRKS